MPADDPKRVVAAHGGVRADRALADLLGVGRRRARELIESGLATIRGRRFHGSDRLEAGVEILIASDPTMVSDGAAIRDRPRIVWTDGRILVVNKPRGFHSVRGLGQPSIADFLAGMFPGIEAIGDGARDCGLVHRLDRDTSGVLLATTDPMLHSELRAAFSRAAVVKTYLALVEGSIGSPFTIDVPLVHRKTGVRPARRGEASRPATTEIEPLETGDDWSLVRCTMKTGVTHQIRAHLAHAGHPLAGDDKYLPPGMRARVAAEGGHRLHAFGVRVSARLEVSVAPPRAFLETLAALRSASTRNV